MILEYKVFLEILVYKVFLEKLVLKVKLVYKVLLDKQVYLDPKIAQWLVALVQATRGPDRAQHIRYGASPRGSLALANSSKARALLNGRTYVTPEDVQALALDALRHRVILSYEGLAAGLTVEGVLTEILATTPLPV